MRINWNLIKGVLLLGLVVFLYAFSSFTNNNRPVTKVDVQFTGKENVYITTEMVNKLLIQNQEQLYILPKDNLDLKEMEFLLESDDMIKSAQVYLTVNGEVRTKIEQKQPIARVILKQHFTLMKMVCGCRCPRNTVRVCLWLRAMWKKKIWKRLYDGVKSLYGFVFKNVCDRDSSRMKTKK